MGELRWAALSAMYASAAATSIAGFHYGYPEAALAWVIAFFGSIMVLDI